MQPIGAEISHTSYATCYLRASDWFIQLVQNSADRWHTFQCSLLALAALFHWYSLVLQFSSIHNAMKNLLKLEYLSVLTIEIQGIILSRSVTSIAHCAFGYRCVSESPGSSHFMVLKGSLRHFKKSVHHHKLS